MSVTLAALERDLAARVGPYRQVTLNSDTHTGSLFFSDALKSTINLGGVTDLYVLRRGVKADGTAVPGFTANDRVRVAKEYDAPTGGVTVDRTYTTTPVASEVVELHHLDPANELRPVVLAGLRRCYFVDRATLTLTGAAAERDLTALAGWITDPSQVYAVEYLPASAISVPSPVRWWNALSLGSGVSLQASPDPFPASLLVTARRSYFTYFQAAGDTDYDTHLDGPTDDADTFRVDLDYAAAAAHVEAWRRCKPRLREPANRGLAVTQQEAAEAFTRQAYQHFSPPPPRIQLGRPSGTRGVEWA